MHRWVVAACLVVVASATIHAGQFNNVLNIGDDAPAWVELPGTDGKKHSLADLKAKSVVVVVFTCNSCPVAEDYEPRIMAFAKKHGGADGHVAIVAINVNKVPEDRLDKMTERAKEREFNFAYLHDESQKIAKSFGATYTPEFFVLDKDRKIAYMGAMDDKGPPAEPTTSFLDRAVEATLKGEKVTKAETLARGCKVRYVRPR